MLSIPRVGIRLREARAASRGLINLLSSVNSDTANTTRRPRDPADVVRKASRLIDGQRVRVLAQANSLRIGSIGKESSGPSAQDGAAHPEKAVRELVARELLVRRPSAR
jgi:hypothetical protein